MKHILTVGKSISDAMGIAENLIEKNGEDLHEKKRDPYQLITDKAVYTCVAAYYADRPGNKSARYDGVYVDGNLTANEIAPFTAIAQEVPGSLHTV